jgi:heavy metal sensor kinase
MNIAHKALQFVRGLRFRLALSYVIFFSVLLVSLGVVFRETLTQSFENRVEDVLDEEWGAVKGYLRFGSLGPEWFYDHYDPEESFIVERLRRVYLLTDSQGHRMQSSQSFDALGMDSPDYIKSVLSAGPKAKAIRTRMDSQGVAYVIRSGVITDQEHHVYYLAIGRSFADYTKVIQDFTWKYFSIISGVIVLSGLLGWFLAGRALEPVNSVAETAQRITHSNLDMTIPLRGAGDELDRLVEAFNRMMERLHASFEQIQRFSTDVSHELRTPLTVIRGQLEVALFTAKTADQYRDAMVNALEDVERLSNIVRALLMLSQAESGQVLLKMTEFDFAELVRDLVDEYQIPAEASRVGLTARLPEHCNLRADRVQIERLVTNLVSNAVKYTPEGGHVEVSLAAEDGFVKLMIEDDGVGIAPDHLPHIFDRFYRVPSSDPEKGLGLGLSFVAWIVRAHGGTVNVESELQKGTKFTVRFPAPETPAPVHEPVAVGTSSDLLG